jgi:tripeptide aminopeptidase
MNDERCKPEADGAESKRWGGGTYPKLQNALVERFTRYAGFWTTSDASNPDTPSSAGQWELAKHVQAELRTLGIDCELTDHCYLLARLPSNIPRTEGSAGKAEGGAPVIGFAAHLDTSGDVSGRDVKPAIVRGYDGGRIALADGVVLDPQADGDLALAKGKTLIHADGTTLLGADDKAGIAAIVTAAAFLVAHPDIPHPDIEIILTPDEETGRMLPHFPRDKVRSSVCYTVDGGAGGELEAECFNAASADVRFTGRAIHPGAARGRLVNAALMAAEFAAMLPRLESPEATDGRDGYYCLMNIRGGHEEALAELIVRDFEADGIERRLNAVRRFASAIEARFPGGKASVEVKPSYRNMRDVIAARPEVLETLKEAARRAGTDYRFKPIRGGTDGARLCELGIPAPNIFTGGRNFHSRTEWLLAEDLLASCRLLIELAAVWALR